MRHSIWSQHPGGAPQRIIAGEHPAIGDARVRAREGRLVWERSGAEFVPDAGSGVASLIVDLVVHGETQQPGAPSTAPAAAAAGMRERAIPVDQTHVSVIVDERYVVKIVSLWGSADRSASLLERLRAAGSTAVPEFFGSLLWEHPTAGSTVLGLVSEYIPDAEDGWSWAVADAVAHIADDAAEPDWPQHLGRLAADLHANLGVEGAMPGDADDRRAGMRARATDALERLSSTLDPNDDFGQRMLGRKHALLTAISSIPERTSAPLLTSHGDFHVGQVLRTAAQRYLVLDFDGDPQWPQSRLFELDGAASDIAHMLASIDLVAAVVQRRIGRVDERAWQWGERAQAQFLDAYRAASAPGIIDERALDGLIAEQLIAEITYAERFRPEWRYAPDGVISRRYARTALPDTHTPSTAQNMERPWSPPASPKI